MKKLLWVVVAAALMASVGIASAQDKTSPDSDKPAVYREKAGTITATVQAVDLGKRVVTVKGGPRGQTVDLLVGKEVKNLRELKVGDTVSVQYFASVAVRIKKAGVGEAGESMEKSATKGLASQSDRISVTATIQDIDRGTNNVFLKWPEGAIVGVQVKDPSILEGLKAGDQVVITYTEAKAISIEKKNR